MAVDFLTDQNDAIQIVDGDLKIYTSDEQHIDHLLRTTPGDVKDYPLLGVGIHSFINAPFSNDVKQRLKKKIRLQLLSDEANNIAVSYQDKLIVSATYGG